jgi:hypothetical protein
MDTIEEKAGMIEDKLETTEDQLCKMWMSVSSLIWGIIFILVV